MCLLAFLTSQNHRPTHFELSACLPGWSPPEKGGWPDDVALQPPCSRRRPGPKSVPAASVARPAPAPSVPTAAPTAAAYGSRANPVVCSAVAASGRLPPTGPGALDWAQQRSGHPARQVAVTSMKPCTAPPADPGAPSGTSTPAAAVRPPCARPPTHIAQQAAAAGALFACFNALLSLLFDAH